MNWRQFFGDDLEVQFQSQFLDMPTMPVLMFSSGIDIMITLTIDKMESQSGQVQINRHYPISHNVSYLIYFLVHREMTVLIWNCSNLIQSQIKDSSDAVLK